MGEEATNQFNLPTQVGKATGFDQPPGRFPHHIEKLLLLTGYRVVIPLTEDTSGKAWLIFEGDGIARLLQAVDELGHEPRPCNEAARRVDLVQRHHLPTPLIAEAATRHKAARRV